MNIKQAIEQGLLIKSKSDKSKSTQSLKIAKDKLEEAQKSLEADIYESTIVFSYMAMFHAARSLIFKTGYIEKSHYGILVFLEELYEKKLSKKLIHEFNTMRISRHESLYGLEPDFTKKDAEYAIEVAKKFIEKVYSL